jgi:selenocysteine-specific elongation factor
MLSGASGIDHALLLVAADDGPMPQTREHVAALALLGVRSATLVVTKADRADPARITAVAAEAQALLAGTPLAGAATHVVAASTGEGIAQLREHLVALSLQERSGAGDDDGPGAPAFRLAIDRVFTLAGAGTVATGTAHSGRVAVGDMLVAAPDPAGLGPVRVRGLHAQSVAVEAAEAGQRVALQLAGVEKSTLPRGGWLVDPRVALETARLDAALTVWRDEAKALRSGTTVHVHVGAEDVLATVHVLDGVGDTGGKAGIGPAASGRVQLVLRRPIAAWRGDRIVLRDASATRMVAGGTVLDPFAPTRHRTSAERLAELDALAQDTLDARLEALLAASPHGVDLDRFHRAEGIAEPAWRGATRAGTTIDADASVAIAAAAADGWRDRIVVGLARFHAERPDTLGPDPARLRRLVAPRLGERAWRLVLQHAVASGAAVRSQGLVHLPQQAVRLTTVEQRIAQKALPRLLEGGFDPPWVRTLATDLREPEAQMRAALLRLAQRGELHQVVKDLFYPTATMARAAALVRTLAARDGDVTAAAFRDASGLGRKRAIQLVEHLDRTGLLRRVGDVHRLRPDCHMFTDTADCGPSRSTPLARGLPPTTG